jgi:hypothetical protein
MAIVEECKYRSVSKNFRLTAIWKGGKVLPKSFKWEIVDL